MSKTTDPPLSDEEREQMADAGALRALRAKVEEQSAAWQALWRDKECIRADLAEERRKSEAWLGELTTHDGIWVKLSCSQCRREYLQPGVLSTMVCPDCHIAEERRQREEAERRRDAADEWLGILRERVEEAERRESIADRKVMFLQAAERDSRVLRRLEERLANLRRLDKQHGVHSQFTPANIRRWIAEARDAEGE